MADIISLAERRAAKVGARPLAAQETEQQAILRLIQEIADSLGIDPEAPFRRKPADRASEP